MPLEDRLSGPRTVAGLLLGFAGLLAGCTCPESGPGHDSTQLATVMEAAKTAAQAFLTQRAKDAGSSETYVFESLAEEGSEIVLKYRTHDPHWVILSHPLVKVAYDPRTKTVRFVGR